METLQKFSEQLLIVGLDSGLWLLLGLIVSGMIKVWLPQGIMDKFLKGQGIKPVINAAIIGTPLPLCSCSVVPAALAMRERGTSKGATVSFLISTPENGADSIALSYALLGPFMTIVRPITAIISAVVAGTMTLIWAGEDNPKQNTPNPQAHNQNKTPTSQTSCNVNQSCCATNKPTNEKTQTKQTFSKQLIGVFTYGLVELIDDIAFWMTIGLVLAAVMNTFLAPDDIASWGWEITA